MRKLIAYPVSVIYYLFFGFTLVVFHGLQWFCLNVFGYKAHKISVDWLQFFLMRCFNLLGTRFNFKNPYKFLNDKPLIIVANHQSLFDIPPLIWHFRKHHVKFVSKKELGHGFPSVSYNLRNGGSVLIDRREPVKSLKAITEFSKRIAENKWAAAIFPEGTRSRNGQPKPFKKQGLLALFKNAPNAVIAPVTINNSWKVQRYGFFPMGIGAHIKFTVHAPLHLNNFEDREALIDQIESTITNAIIPISTTIDKTNIK